VAQAVCVFLPGVMIELSALHARPGGLGTELRAEETDLLPVVCCVCVVGVRGWVREE
jgi:hypothetical protein